MASIVLDRRPIRHADIIRVAFVRLTVASAGFMTEFGCLVRVRLESAEPAASNHWSGT
jgi:hypothetical protein